MNGLFALAFVSRRLVTEYNHRLYSVECGSLSVLNKPSMFLIFLHEVYFLEVGDEYYDETSRPEAAETNTHVQACATRSV
jgi:hypothetical protein